MSGEEGRSGVGDRSEVERSNNIRPAEDLNTEHTHMHVQSCK